MMEDRLLALIEVREGTVFVTIGENFRGPARSSVVLAALAPGAIGPGEEDRALISTGDAHEVVGLVAHLLHANPPLRQAVAGVLTMLDTGRLDGQIIPTSPYPFFASGGPASGEGPDVQQEPRAPSQSDDDQEGPT